MSAAALSILVVTFTAGEERNLALGVWGATSGVAGALGVILGGAFTSGPGWEWVFFINVPIGSWPARQACGSSPRTAHRSDHRSIRSER
jgi:MFS family permease